MDIQVETTKIASLNRYRLELDCAKERYNFWAYTEAGNVEASFTDLTKEELEQIIQFLTKAKEE